MSPDDPRHGTTRGHAAGCRLPCCREARNADERRRRKHRQVFGTRRRIDGTGTRRRIQALWAIGWTSRHIADACGWATPQAVTEVVAVRRSVFATTAATIARVYEQMSMTPGPSAKNRREAIRKGWPPPLAWDDIDNPDEQPRDWHYQSADRAEALRDLADMGAGITEACRRLHVGREALEKWCQRKGLSDVYRQLAAREAAHPNQWNQEVAS